VVGGPQGDAGLTARKIIVGHLRAAPPATAVVAFLRKDPLKVDPLRCYAAAICGQEPLWRQAWPSRLEVAAQFIANRAGQADQHPVQSFGTG